MEEAAAVQHTTASADNNTITFNALQEQPTATAPSQLLTMQATRVAPRCEFVHDRHHCTDFGRGDASIHTNQ